MSEETSDLIDRGFELLRDGELEEALSVGRELEERRHTAGFDIAAQAHAGLGDVEEGVRVLERGVEAEPDCWLNWQLLGNLRSDLERFDAAEEAFERAHACTETWADSVYLNQAILASRRGDQEQALAILGDVQDPELELRAESMRVHALEQAGRKAEAIERAEHALSSRSVEEPDSETFDVLAGIAANLGHLYLDRGEDPEEVRELAYSWCTPSMPDGDLLALVRQLDGAVTATAKRYRLLLHGEVSADLREEDEGVGGFYVVVEAVADDAQEGLGFVRRYFPESLAPVLEVESAEEHGDGADLLKGVYWQSELHSYEKEDGGEEHSH